MGDERMTGCADCGGSCGGGGNCPTKTRVSVVGGTGWREAPILQVAEWAPQIALARATRTQLVPWLLNIRGTFQSSQSPIGPFSWKVADDVARLNSFAIVDRIVFQVDAPNNNAGMAIKPQTDFFFGLQSGIEATLIVDGDPKYVPAPDFTPIRSLVAMLAEAWPQGWVLNYTQACKMQFNISSAALVTTFPTKVTVTWRLWIPNMGTAKGKRFWQMTDRQAYHGLKKMGYSVDNLDPDLCGPLDE